MRQRKTQKIIIVFVAALFRRILAEANKKKVKQEQTNRTKNKQKTKSAQFNVREVERAIDALAIDS